MRRMVILLLILLSPGALAWDQFKGGPDHASIAPSNEMVNGTLRWKFITGGEVSGSPAVGEDGTVFASSTDGNLYSIARNGELKWAFDAGASIWTSPALAEDGKVLFVDEQGTLYCLNGNGVEVWRYRAREEVYHSSPTVDWSGNIYFGTSGGTLHSIRSDGKPRWFYKTEDFIDSTPALDGDGTVFVTSGDGTVHAVSQLGRAKWEGPFKAKGAISSSPCIAKDGSILVGSEDGYLYRIGSDGTQRWRARVGEVDLSSPAVDGERAYIGTMEGDMVCVEEGSVKWRFPTGHAIECSPVVRDDHTIIFGSTDEYLYCLDPDGKVLWKFSSGGFFGSSSPGFDSDGTIVVGNGDGAIYSIGKPYPPSPLFLIAVPGDGNITLGWTMPENVTVVEFNVYRSLGGEDYKAILSTVSNFHLDAGLMNGVSYSYKVTAVNDVGEGPASNVATEIPREVIDHGPDGGEVEEGFGPIDLALIGSVLIAIAAIIWLYRRGKE
jgi:outer membrane protein assembly factor BamB